MQSHLCVSFLRSRLHNGTLISLTDCNAVASDFTFPEDAAWNAERWAVEFGVEIGEYHGVDRVRRVFQRRLPDFLGSIVGLASGSDGAGTSAAKQY
jgi:hypothetical protein